MSEKKISNNSDVNIENSWIFLSKDGFTKDSETHIISLSHPGCGNKSKFLFNRTTNKLFEIQVFENTYRSWLIDNTLRKNGNIYVCTPIDPIFIVLPLLKEQCLTRAVPLEHILQSDENSDLKYVYSVITDLNTIGDLKGPKSLNAYKYNEEKVLNWLESKVKNVASVLKKKKVHVKPGAVAATFVVSSLEEESVDEEYYLNYAFGIVCEYLNDDFVQLLQNRLNIKTETDSVKRKSTKDISNEPKKLKLDSDVETLEESDKSNYFSNNSFTDKKPKPVTLSAKEKQRQKAASGSKNIASFFSKKS